MKLPRLPHALFSVLGMAIWSAGNFLMNSGIAKKGTPTEQAAYLIALAVATPICDFAFLGLRGLQNSDGKGEYSFGEYLALRLAGIATSLSVLLAWAAISQETPYAREMTLLFALRVALDAVIEIYNGLTQRLGRLDLAALSLAGRGVIGTVGFLSGLLLGYGLVGALVGQAAASLLMLIAVDAPTAARTAARSEEKARVGRVLENGLLPAFHWDNLGRLLKLAFPLGITILLVSANSQIGRLFAAHFLSQVEFRTFGFLFTLTALVKIFIVSLGIAASTSLGSARAAADRKWFVKTANRLLGAAGALTLLTVVGAAVAGRPAVALVYRPEFAQDGFLIVLMFLAGGVACLASAQGYILTALRVLKVQVPIYGFGLLSAIALNAALMPTLGARGAAWAFLGSSLIIVAVSQHFIAKAMRGWEA
ncbi:hypothetical protein EON79_18245 [bacterium]|nr:MAG: hypothetical protein EON79_18245 [bacterium]